jgi:hypothetical protein
MLGNTWQYLTILAIPDKTFTILTIIKESLPIPNNTNLPKKLGIGWYHLVLTIHPASLPLGFQYYTIQF